MHVSLARTERLLRSAMPAALGLGLCAYLYVAGRLAPSPITPTAAVVILAQVYVIWEICRVVFAMLDRRLGWRRGVAVRLGAQLGLSTLVAIAYAIAIYVPIKLWLIARGEHDAIGWMQLSLIALPASGVALFAGLTQFTLRFFAYWRESELQAEIHKRESLRSQLEVLQAQVNPHFLFNSLNALYGTIAEDPARAQSLVLKLADVFRYALRHGQVQLAPLGDELAFLSTYVELLKVRHGEAFDVQLRLGGDEGRYGLPPLTLQLLVENAIKHNMLSEHDTLTIRIDRDGDRLVVTNPLRPRREAPIGAGIGLKNIRRRFALIDPRPVLVAEDAGQFSVSLPLVRNTP